jgi:hypothetical protein
VRAAVVLMQVLNFKHFRLNAYTACASSYLI